MPWRARALRSCGEKRSSRRAAVLATMRRSLRRQSSSNSGSRPSMGSISMPSKSSASTSRVTIS
jgi:hypothetical protein